jgi:hypothetical protein
MIAYRLRPRVIGPSDTFVGATVRISEDARRCVVFFGVTTPKGIEYGGTGFLASYEEDGFVAHYLVTCRHVAAHLNIDFFVRANKKDGPAEDVPIESVRWEYHSDPNVDVAVAPFHIMEKGWDMVYIPLNRVLHDPKKDVYGGLSTGDQIAIVGLFRLRIGTRRNVPIVHCGHIAALSDPDEKIPMRNRISGQIKSVEGYLVEAQTLEGLSGSPVFVQRYIKLPGKGKFGDEVYAFERIDFLGVYQGAWDSKPGEILAADRNLDDTSYRVPVGVGIVISGEKIMDVIKGGRLAKEHAEYVASQKGKNAAVTDAAFSKRPANDANPTHREDFNKLLGKAAKSQKHEIE